MDLDESGNIAFYEFAAMVRKELHVPRTDMSTERLIGVWKAVDTSPTGQGRIGVGEFGKFMNKGRAQRRRSRTKSGEQLRVDRPVHG